VELRFIRDYRTVAGRVIRGQSWSELLLDLGEKGVYSS